MERLSRLGEVPMVPEVYSALKKRHTEQNYPAAGLDPKYLEMHGDSIQAAGRASSRIVFDTQR